MPRRPPITLWVYISVEMWKLVLLTAAVLVTVIAFAAAVKPLADGKLGPEDTVTFMLLAMVPMLQYALPFAACFGATLAYHRLSSDNELTAAYAGGVSHRTLLVPALLSGVVLAVVLLALSNAVIPRFLRQMATIVSQDAARWVATAVQRGEALELPGSGTFLYADKVITAQPPAGADYDALQLLGVLVVKLDDKGAVEGQVSASRADVWFRRSTSGRAGAAGKPVTQVIIRPRDMAGVGTLQRGQAEETTLQFEVPNAFSENVKFLSFSELRAVRDRPDRIDKVDRVKRELAVVVAEREVVAGVAADLASTGRAEFLDPYGQERVTVFGSGLRTTRREGQPNPRVLEILPARGGGVTVERAERVAGAGAGWRVTTTSRGASAVLRLRSSPEPDETAGRVTVQLLNVATRRAGAEGELETPEEILTGRAGAGADPRLAGEAQKSVIADLRYAGVDAPGALQAPTDEVVRRAEGAMAAKPADARVLDRPLADLRKRTRLLMHEILSKEQERFAMSAACLVMVLVGAVMAMRLRGALPLTVYLWAFFPALATVLAISGGQQLTHTHGWPGLSVLWAGVGALGLFALAEFARLARH